MADHRPDPFTRRRATVVRIVGALAVAAVAVAGLVAGWVQWERGIERADAMRTAAAERASDAITQELTASLGALEALAAAMGSGDDDARFTATAKAVLRDDLVTLVVWLQRVEPHERAAFERAIGRPVMRMRPGAPAVPAAADVAVTPIARQVASAPWPDLRGVELSAFPQVADTGADAMRRPGQALVSAPGRLAVGEDGVAMVVGVADRRGEYRGAVATTVTASALQRLAARVLDPGMDAAIHDGDRTIVGAAHGAGTTEGPTVEIGGRVWHVAVAGGPSASATLPVVLALGGLLLAGALAGLLWVWSRREGYARDQVAARMAERAVLEDELRRARDWSAGLVSSMRDGVVVTDARGRIVFANDAFCTMTGYGADELVGAGPADWPYLDDAGRAALTADVPSARTAHRVREMEVTFVRADGTCFPGSVSLSSLREPAGAGGWVSVVHDLSERVRAENELRAERDHTAAVLGALTDGLVLLDGDGRITHVNARFCAMTGYDEDALVGTGPGEYPYFPGGADEARRYIAELAASSEPVDIPLTRADGSSLPVMVAAAPLDPAAPSAGILCTVKDMTERVRQERDLERLASEQAALRRVATRVAAIDDPARVFQLVAEEAARLLELEAGAVTRFEDGHAVIMGSWLAPGATRDGRLPFRALDLDGPSAIARVAASGRAARVDHYGAESDDGRVLERLGMRGGVAAPVRVHGVLWGAVAGVTRDAALLGAGAEERLGRFADLVGLALQNIEDRREIRRMAAQQAAVGRVATSALGSEDLTAVLHGAAREAATLVGASAAVVLRADAGGGLRRVAIWRNERAGALPGEAPARIHGAAADVAAAAGRPRLVSDVVADDGPLARALAGAGVRSAVMVPVVVAGDAWGAMLLCTAEADAFDGREADRLAKLGEVVALAVAGADARAELAERALHDPLTGLANHRAFFARVEDEIARSRRRREPLALVMLDVDRFKMINDTRGHQAGDQALARVADAIRQHARAGELVGRIGGDEFAWVLPGADLDGARAAAERARMAVRQITMPGVGRLSLSVGVSELHQARDMAELVHLADGALYHAKAEGRDRVVCYSPEVVTDFSAEERAAHALRDQAMSGLRALARAVDAKDPDTREHSERVGRLAVLLARARGWAPECAEQLREAALVHDVGKIGVPDRVLFKPGRLAPAEYEIVKDHVVLSGEIADEVLGPEQVAWVRAHHERWDGSGYPARLAGVEIPEGGRILALADAWDVMRSVRAYKDRMGVDGALAECRRMAGEQFDPALVAVLGRLWAAGLLDQLPDVEPAAHGRPPAGAHPDAPEPAPAPRPAAAAGGPALVAVPARRAD